MSPQDIIEFIFFPVVNEGCRVIAEGIVDKPADLDVATVLSMGFPAYRYDFQLLRAPTTQNPTTPPPAGKSLSIFPHSSNIDLISCNSGDIISQ